MRTRPTSTKLIAIVLALVVLMVLTAASAGGQTSRSISAASYLERGNDWYTKKDLERAIADYDIALTRPGQRRGLL